MNRFVILDENGYFLNSCLADSPYPHGVRPDVGRYVVYGGDDPAPPPPDDTEIAPGFTYLTVRPSIPMQRGYQMNILTGEVTIPPPPAPEGE